MKFFLDTADVAEIADLASAGMVDGVTTNPSLVAKTGRDLFELLAEIADLVPGPISAEVTATEQEDMLREAHRLAEIAKNICIKLPLTWDGLRACRRLAAEGIKVNLTLCFSPGQALLAAKAGATFVSPFVGRLDDAGHEGMELIEDICTIYGNYPDAIRTEVLVASIRSVGHVIEAARLGADVATMPAKVMRALVQHPLTDKGLAQFLADWEKTGQRIV